MWVSHSLLQLAWGQCILKNLFRENNTIWIGMMITTHVTDGSFTFTANFIKGTQCVLEALAGCVLLQKPCQKAPILWPPSCLLINTNNALLPNKFPPAERDGLCLTDNELSEGIQPQNLRQNRELEKQSESSLLFIFLLVFKIVSLLYLLVP